MSAAYLLFMAVILSSRLVYLTNDAALPGRANAALSAVQVLVLLLLFELNAVLAGALLVVILMGAVSALMEPRIDLRSGFRLVTLLVLLLVPGYLASRFGGFVMRDWLVLTAGHLHASLPFFEPRATVDASRGLLVACGLLVLANEANILVRAVFHHCRLEPILTGYAEEVAAEKTAGSGRIDKVEYNAGRVIGFLERWLMFIVVINTGNFNALAFILAAKGLARMKQLEDKQFAEYMLIGTLMSALCAIVLGVYVESWL